MIHAHKGDSVAKSLFSTESIECGLKELNTVFFRIKGDIFPDMQYNDGRSWIC